MRDLLVSAWRSMQTDRGRVVFLAVVGAVLLGIWYGGGGELLMKWFGL